jgi:hypothetical protein
VISCYDIGIVFVASNVSTNVSLSASLNVLLVGPLNSGSCLSYVVSCFAAPST